jgi:thiaminase
MMREFIEANRQEMDAIRTYPFEEPRAYAQFLAQTRHYVVHSTRLLAAAAARIEEEREALHMRFLQHAAEERSHHRLAEHDLRKLGRQIDQFPELPPTQALYQSQYYRVEHQAPTALFGYIFMLEGLSVAHGAWIHERVTQAHGKEAATFVKLHANEDEDHLEKAFDVVNQLGEKELSLIRENYLFTCSIYRLFLEAAGSKA